MNVPPRSMPSHDLYSATVFECKDTTRNLIRGGSIGLSNSTSPDDMNIGTMLPLPWPDQAVMEELTVRAPCWTSARQLIGHHQIFEHLNLIYRRGLS
jgi:hypothetical protein